MAAVLLAGPGAALAGKAAARHWGIRRRGAPQIDVLTPRKIGARPGIRFRTPRRLLTRDVTKRNGIWITTVARTILDLADELTPHQLANVLHEAEFRKRLNRRALDDVLARARGRRAVTVVRGALRINATGSAGTKSELEDRLLDLLDQLGWDAPLVNMRLEVNGGALEVDAHWPDLRLVIEVDGSGHRRNRTQREDRDRDGRLVSDGWTVIRVGPADLVSAQALADRLADVG